METFLLILKYVGGPLLGAVIGYFTNWLAVRMLFRPYYPKKIGKWRLPFTPGIIPKRKGALAKAVGKAVGEQLFTKEDFASVISSDAAKQNVADIAVNFWKSAGEKTAAQFLDEYIPDEREKLIKSAEGFLSDRIYSAVGGMNLGAVVAEEGAKAISKKKASLGMLAMVLSDGLIYSVAEKLGEGVNRYVEENGRRLIESAVEKEFEKTLGSPLKNLTEKIDESVVRKAACALFDGAVNNLFSSVAESLDVCAVVEEKINAMDVKELEKLVLSVMKKELNAIVNLGALIGLILGVVMIFV